MQTGQRTTRQRIALETKAAIKATRAAAKTEKTAKQLRKAEMQRAWRMKTVEVEAVHEEQNLDNPFDWRTFVQPIQRDVYDPHSNSNRHNGDRA